MVEEMVEEVLRTMNMSILACQVVICGLPVILEPKHPKTMVLPFVGAKQSLGIPLIMNSGKVNSMMIINSSMKEDRLPSIVSCRIMVLKDTRICSRFCNPKTMRLQQIGVMTGVFLPVKTGKNYTEMFIMKG